MNQDAQDDENTIQAQDEDNDTPFSPPTDTESGTPNPQHQRTDSNIQAEEVYDEGLPGAAEADEPNLGNAVTDFDPDKIK